MHGDGQDQVVSLIYEAALNGERWAEAVRAVAAITGSSQCVLHFFDQTGLNGGLAPMMDPDSVASYKERWRQYSPHWRHAVLYPVGRIFDFDDREERETIRHTAIYNEWWAPQGLGFGMRGANLVADDEGTVMASVYKPRGEEFSSEERRRFDGLVDHLVRAVEIHRRLRLAQLAAAQGADAAQSGFLVVDRRGRLLSDDGPTCASLAEAGFLVSDGARRRLRTFDRSLERLIAGNGHVSGGSCELMGDDGVLLRFTVVPVHGEAEPAPHWLQIDQPAALVHVAVPEAQRRSRIQRLIEAHRLTRAEADVAVEIARGDGRAAVAERLGIRETTVRSHLTAIFDKLGVHRQSELVNLVAGPL